MKIVYLSIPSHNACFYIFSLSIILHILLPMKVYRCGPYKSFLCVQLVDNRNWDASWPYCKCFCYISTSTIVHFRYGSQMILSPPYLHSSCTRPNLHSSRHIKKYELQNNISVSFMSVMSCNFVLLHYTHIQVTVLKNKNWKKSVFER